MNGHSGIFDASRSTSALDASDFTGVRLRKVEETSKLLHRRQKTRMSEA